MPGTDLTALLSGWVQDAIDGGCMGEEFGYAAIATTMQLPGGATGPAWAVVVTLRSPLLGSPPLAVKLNVPLLVVTSGNTATVAQAVQQAMGTLRQQHTQVLQALRNGGPARIPAPPPGLAQGN